MVGSGWEGWYNHKGRYRRSQHDELQMGMKLCNMQGLEHSRESRLENSLSICMGLLGFILHKENSQRNIFWSCITTMCYRT
ncbi:unnamed protein product [Calypogeia fissa]